MQHSDPLSRLTLTIGFVLATSLGLASPTRAQTGDIQPAVLLPAHFTGEPYLVGPTVSATPSVAAGEAEEQIAVDPNHPNVLVAAITDFTLGPSTTRYAWSTDNGASWASHFVPLKGSHTVTADGRSWGFNSDPVVAIDRLGHVYLSHMCVNSTVGASNQIITNGTGIYVGMTMTTMYADQALIPFSPSDLRPAFLNTQPVHPGEDKDWITVDNSNSPFSGNVYVVWAHLVDAVVDGAAGNSTIWLTRTTDHGYTWSAPLSISPTVFAGTNPLRKMVEGAQVAVGPQGQVYVLYDLFDGRQGPSYDNTGTNQLFLTVSADGGQTFTTPTPVTAPFTPVNGKPSWRRASDPAMAVSPRTGTVFIVYPDRQGDTSQVEFIRSTDGGRSFSSPVTLDDDPGEGERSMPAIAVDEQGIVHCSWFDSRNTPKSLSDYDIYATYSADDGATFAPNARVTSAPVRTSSGFIGDYASIAAGGGFAHPVWPGAGAGSGGHLLTATLTLPAGVGVPAQAGQGDVTGEGPITVGDAILALRIAIGTLIPTDAQKKAADANGDGKVDVADVTLILQRAIGL